MNDNFRDGFEKVAFAPAMTGMISRGLKAAKGLATAAKAGTKGYATKLKANPTATLKQTAQTAGTAAKGLVKKHPIATGVAAGVGLEKLRNNSAQ